MCHPCQPVATASLYISSCWVLHVWTSSITNHQQRSSEFWQHLLLEWFSVSAAEVGVSFMQRCLFVAGTVADNMTEGTKESQSQVSSATQHVPLAKANWRQARPPKAADVKQEQQDQDHDLQSGAAFLAGIVLRQPFALL